MLPVTFGALDGEATWLDEERRRGRAAPARRPLPDRDDPPALFTALRTGFAEALLREAFVAVRDLRARRRRERGLAPGEAALGLGKLLVVAPDQENARRYLETAPGLGAAASQAGSVAQLATSDSRARTRPWPPSGATAGAVDPGDGRDGL